MLSFLSFEIQGSPPQGDAVSCKHVNKKWNHWQLFSSKSILQDAEQQP